ncbi:MAG: hypothetical protein JKY88_15535 [Pseudomonadales bacterium]|nr:hypothetical protein [Pseudomonadales bacterium]
MKIDNLNDVDLSAVWLPGVHLVAGDKTRKVGADHPGAFYLAATPKNF